MMDVLTSEMINKKEKNHHIPKSKVKEIFRKVLILPPSAVHRICYPVESFLELCSWNDAVSNNFCQKNKSK